MPLWGQTVSCYTCKNPFNYSVKSSLPFISRLSPGMLGDSRERVRVRAKQRNGEEGGWKERREGRRDG